MSTEQKLKEEIKSLKKEIKQLKQKIKGNTESRQAILKMIGLDKKAS